MLNLPLGQLAFMNPWILTGLLALPLLWFLLRVFPPAPRLIRLPGAWLLEGLIPDEQTTSKTPWWLILLRSVLAALILVALAQPVVNPAQSLGISGNMRLVIENGWDAGQTWNRQIQVAEHLLDQAGRDKREIYILTTAPDPGQAEPSQQGPMTVAQTRTILRGLKPRAWPADAPAAAL
ncbi:MAG: BatA domain-containing protein, partial [Micavibrio aeruginosavorus]|nr:BatA domain-containing protein [Micavibrio aeruginosavorus]